MDKVKINKEKLLKCLKKNRGEHKAIYELAHEGWKEEVTKALEEAFQNAKVGEEYITFFDIEEPEHHLKEYDEILERISWHEENVIFLDIREFNNFVRDNWDWSYSFLNQATHYSTSSSSSSSSSGMTILKNKMKNLR